eukprot:6727418-Heterocapsa_arctica.AAC.1
MLPSRPPQAIRARSNQGAVGYHGGPQAFLLHLVQQLKAVLRRGVTFAGRRETRRHRTYSMTITLTR